ncbi:hypothetical protein Hanom_Chr10g00955421 [Helianthus anomalus]
MARRWRMIMVEAGYSYWGQVMVIRGGSGSTKSYLQVIVIGVRVLMVVAGGSGGRVGVCSGGGGGWMVKTAVRF